MSIGAASEAPDGASLVPAMEGCTAQDLDRVVCDALAEASGAVIVVPSTAPTTALVSRLSDRWGVGIAADPVAFLRACGEGKRQHAFVFTDRFVSAETAPLLVSRRGRREFFPAFETIAVRRYGMTLYCWTGADFECLRPASADRDLLRAIDRYYAACERLPGETWLMRDQQVQRTVQERIGQARRLIRLYQSIALRSGMAAPGVESRTLFETLSQLDAHLPVGEVA